MSGTSTKLMEVWNWLAEDNLNIFFFQNQNLQKGIHKIEPNKEWWNTGLHKRFLIDKKGHVSR